MSHAVVAVGTWIYSRLSTDSTVQSYVGTRIFDSLAPQGTSVPFVLFSLQAGEDLTALGARRLWSSLIYQIKVIGKASGFVPLRDVVGRIDTLLHGASGSTSEGSVWSCIRQQPISYTEIDGGTEYRHLGGLYQINVSE